MNRSVGLAVIYPELSYKIMETAYAVHNGLGPGFSEEIYEAATLSELQAQQIPHVRQKVIKVTYRDRVVGTYRLDLVIAGKIILELKAVTELPDLHKRQVLSYLKATGLHLGILLNFGSTRVQAVRVANARKP